jgi:hypothetical protein
MKLLQPDSLLTNAVHLHIKKFKKEKSLMKTTEYIAMALENGKGWTLGLINDMKDAPLQQPTPNGGNHPLWVLGHIVRAESDLLDGFILGKPK